MDDLLILRALADWYVRNPRVRRACAFRQREEDMEQQSPDVLHVFLDVEPVMDSEEVLPVWLTHAQGWQLQLQTMTGCTVYLGHLHPYETTATVERRAGLAPFMVGAWSREPLDA